MVKIEKNVGGARKEMMVPSGAVAQFLRQGWRKSGSVAKSSNSDNKGAAPVETHEEQLPDVSVDEEDDTSEDSAWDDVETELAEEEYEKPIGEMNEAELRAYAKKHNINISSLNSVKQIRGAIRNANK